MSVDSGIAESKRFQPVVFHRKPAKNAETRSDFQSALVEMLLDANELDRRRLLLVALQTGELKKSEVAELLRLVERLESVSAPGARPGSL
jgi:hypothetical protein